MPSTGRRGGASGLAILFAAFALGCSAHRGAGPIASDTVATAAEDFRAACAPCHGSDARGDGPVAASLRTPPPDLTRLAARHGGTFPFGTVVATIAGEPGSTAEGRAPIAAHGTRQMPVWSLRFGSDTSATAVASISARRRVDALARYLETLQRLP